MGRSGRCLPQEEPNPTAPHAALGHQAPGEPLQAAQQPQPAATALALPATTPVEEVGFSSVLPPTM